MSVGGETEEEKIRIDILENEIMDVRMSLARVCYNPDFVSALLLGWTRKVLIGHWILMSPLCWSCLSFEVLGVFDPLALSYTLSRMTLITPNCLK